MSRHETDYFVRQGDGQGAPFAELYDYGSCTQLAAAVHGPDGWRPELTGLPMPWNMGFCRFSSAAVALTALIPFAVAVGWSEAGMRAAVADTAFEKVQ